MLTRRIKMPDTGSAAGSREAGSFSSAFRRSSHWRATRLPSRPGEFHPEPLTDPDLNLSIHPARATARRLPPSTEREGSSGRTRWPNPVAMTHPLRSSPITEPSSLLRSSPPFFGASVLSASRLQPLAPFPLASPARFSRSAPEPDRASCCLHAGCRSVRLRTSSELISQEGSPRDFDMVLQLSTLRWQFACAHLSRPCLSGSLSRRFRDAHDHGF
jgi:hypothetical protein